MNRFDHGAFPPSFIHPELLQLCQRLCHKVKDPRDQKSSDHMLSVVAEGALSLSVLIVSSLLQLQVQMQTRVDRGAFPSSSTHPEVLYLLQEHCHKVKF